MFLNLLLLSEKFKRIFRPRSRKYMISLLYALISKLYWSLIENLSTIIEVFIYLIRKIAVICILLSIIDQLVNNEYIIIMMVYCTNLCKILWIVEINFFKHQVVYIFRIFILYPVYLIVNLLKTDRLLGIIGTFSIKMFIFIFYQGNTE